MINKNLKVTFIKAKAKKEKESQNSGGSDDRDPIDRDIDMVYRQPQTTATTHFESDLHSNMKPRSHAGTHISNYDQQSSVVAPSGKVKKKNSPRKGGSPFRQRQIITPRSTNKRSPRVIETVI